MKKCERCYFQQRMKNGKFVCQVCQMEDKLRFSDDYRLCDDILECKHFLMGAGKIKFESTTEKRDYEYIYIDDYIFMDSEKVKKISNTREIYLSYEYFKNIEIPELYHQLKNENIEIIACDYQGNWLMTSNGINIELVSEKDIDLRYYDDATQAFGFSERNRTYMCWNSKEEKFDGTWLEYVLSIK